MDKNSQPNVVVANVGQDNDSDNIVIPVPPDGGYGWIVVLASSICLGVMDGVVLSYGLFLNDIADHFNVSTGVAALGSSLMNGFSMIIGPITSGFVNMYGSRSVAMFGSLVIGMSHFSCVFATKFIHFLLLYSFCGGIGVSAVFLPISVHVGFYFEKRRALATGIVFAAGGVGVAIIAPLSAYIREVYGWQGAQWIIGALWMQCAVFAALLRPLEPIKSNKLFRVQVIEPIDVSNKAENDDLSEHGNTVSYDGAVIVPQGPINKQLLTAVKNGDTVSFPDLRATSNNIPNPMTSRVATSSCHAVDFPSSSRIRPNSNSSLRVLTAKQIFEEKNGHAASKMNRLPIQSNPFLRSDAFYTGSVQHLPEYHQSGGQLDLFRETVISQSHLNQRNRNYESESKQGVLAVPEVRMSFLPKQLRSVCLEMMDFRLMKNPVMILLFLSSTFLCLGFHIPYIYTANKAIHCGATSSQAGLLIAILGASTSVGRIVFGWMADNTKISATTLTAISYFICGVSTIIAALLENYYLIAVYSAVYGFNIASFWSLASIINVDYFGLEKLTNSFGLLMMGRGIFVSMGSPIGGTVYHATNSYPITFGYAGVMMVLASVAVFSIHLVSKPARYWCKFKTQLTD